MDDLKLFSDLVAELQEKEQTPDQAIELAEHRIKMLRVIRDASKPANGATRKGKKKAAVPT